MENMFKLAKTVNFFLNLFCVCCFSVGGSKQAKVTHDSALKWKVVANILSSNMIKGKKKKKKKKRDLYVTIASSSISSKSFSFFNHSWLL